MQTSAPIYHLKRQAKRYARDHDVPLHAALNQVAASEGAQSWSHLVASTPMSDHVGHILKRLDPGDLLLLGARPGQGKTLLGLALATAAGRLGRDGFFFTLDYTAQDVTDRLAQLGADAATLHLDTSDGICADYVVEELRKTKAALAVIDYMQLLDQKRSHPSLQSQVATLQAFAKDSGAIFVLISQIDRKFDLQKDAVPSLADVRLPNPLDLTLFDQACFLHDGQLVFETPS